MYTGNALGYVRMVRSASMYYCSEAVKYLPEFEDIINFEDHAGKGVKVQTDEEEGGGIDERVPNSGLLLCAVLFLFFPLASTLLFVEKCGKIIRKLVDFKQVRTTVRVQ